MGCFATEENTEDDNPPIGINYSRRRFKMKSVTRYFRNAVAASMQGTVNYKKERFFVVTEGELLSGKLSEENNFNIWKKEYDAESDNDEEKLKIKNVIIALKTLATEFRYGLRITAKRKMKSSLLYCLPSFRHPGIPLLMSLMQ